ncbi:putative gle1-like protein [Rosellinia necatrix]|uniref:mRNA export factor GLE1 n=1 Tax=Rosellinia necatrix TaxID=77044 RepID=A0A1W2TQ39_ROSNE|nr:putative gle1-like protein [Rosellinia necatrix]
MTGSSPATRQPRQWSSPSRPHMSDFLAENRHTELSHQDALAAAQAEHDRVRHAAISVFKTHELEQECRRLQQQEDIVRQQQQKEEERLRNEERLRAEEERLRALKLKTVPKLPAEAPPPAAVPSLTSTPRLNGSIPLDAILAPVSADKQGSTSAAGNEPHSQKATSSNAPTPPVNGAKVADTPSSQPSQQEQHVALAKHTPFGAPATTGSPSEPSTARQNAPSAPLTSKGPTDKYIVIHQNLKKLRSSLAEQAKSTPALKARMGDMRRELRKSLGQMVTEKGGNKKQTTTIQGLLQESLSGDVPSSMVDPSQYIADQREPMDGALHNEAELPSLFLYLLNIFAKTIINQFINECGAQPKAADPLGVVAAQIFSHKAYHWRGKTLIDILMAKYRVACPVLFGYRGSESTEQGRIRLGWRKDGAGWTPEQQHIDKMKGLAVGYAAISLRDFSKSANTNPWPPSKYWTSLARIVNTPPAEISNTQCVVLRGMIEIYEERFILFYGSAAIAALRSALIEFPHKALIKTPGTSGLPVLAQILKRDIGLEL